MACSNFPIECHIYGFYRITIISFDFYRFLTFKRSNFNGGVYNNNIDLISFDFRFGNFTSRDTLACLIIYHIIIYCLIVANHVRGSHKSRGRNELNMIFALSVCCFSNGQNKFDKSGEIMAYSVLNMMHS